jgi:hypothetical protein
MPAEDAAGPSFAELVERLQHNDRAAVGLLIERYGPALRRSIERVLFVRRLAESGATAGVDPVGSEASDVFQTVLLLFLARLGRQRDGSGAVLQFESPAHLVGYLKAIAAHELGRRTRFPASVRVGIGFDSSAIEPAADGPTPSQDLLARELLNRDEAALAEVVRRFGAEERAIWDLVRQELGWPEIARRLGGSRSPEAVRKTFARAVRRIAEELKTRELSHE